MKASRTLIFALMAVAILAGASAQAAPKAAGSSLTIGLLMVGPYNDHGWSQANFEGVKYVTEKVKGVKMVYIDKVNPADRPGTTAAQLAESLVSQGARLVIFSSDDMMDEANKFAQAHPDIFVIMTSGDQQWKEGKAYKPFPNMVNVMGRMESAKMMAGVVAAMTTKTGQIGYLGPLINDETRRLVASAYLGARYAWVNYLKKDPSQLKFKVSWIGFWFNIPGVTSDPSQVSSDFFNTGHDVVISGIDTTEAVAEAARLTSQGRTAWAIPYDYSRAMDEGKGVSLGVPYFNWGPAYTANAKAAMDGTWKSHFEWNGPDWKNINNTDTSAIGFIKGKLTPQASEALDRFSADLAKGLNLWKGPLSLQDGSIYLKDGQIATDQQVWYLPQLLAGMTGQSVAK